MSFKYFLVIKEKKKKWEKLSFCANVLVMRLWQLL